MAWLGIALFVVGWWYGWTIFVDRQVPLRWTAPSVRYGAAAMAAGAAMILLSWVQ